MPRRELNRPSQIDAWLESWGSKLEQPGEMILIGSGGLLWHAYQAGSNEPLPENSMDVDPITSDEAVAELCYDSIIGSEFERENGWHVNLMPNMALQQLPEGWTERASQRTYGNLKVVVPSAQDLLKPKLERGEPRDFQHFEYSKAANLIDES